MSGHKRVPARDVEFCLDHFHHARSEMDKMNSEQQHQQQRPVRDKDNCVYSVCVTITPHLIPIQLWLNSYGGTQIKRKVFIFVIKVVTKFRTIK